MAHASSDKHHGGYHVVEGTDAKAFAEEVAKMIANGWKPAGGVTVQVMAVRPRGAFDHIAHPDRRDEIITPNPGDPQLMRWFQALYYQVKRSDD